MSDQENKDPDAPVVAFLTTIVNSVDLDPIDQSYRIDAAVAILAYLTKWKGPVESNLRTRVKEAMRKMALDEQLSPKLRIRAAGVAL